MSFEFFCSHWVVLVYPLFFPVLQKCALQGLADGLMASISFHANRNILEASKEGMVLYVPKITEIQNQLPKTCLQVKWISSLSLLLLTWLHTGFINLLWILDSSAVKSQLFPKRAMADPAKPLLDMAVCKSQSSTLDLKTGRMRALIIFLNLNTICSVHMPVTSVKNLFQLLKLASFEIQGTFMFVMRHPFLFPLSIFETCFIMQSLWRTLWRTITCYLRYHDKCWIQ